MSIAKTFGKRLYELRTEKDLSQQALAEILKTNRQNISRWELGLVQPDMDTIAEIAKFFNVKIDLLFGKEEY